ncbi:MAG: chemotaxis protein CheW [Desulfobacterales bacterium]|nr:MAG: chemotaxis protein CheW [Desulfobacterales bacterium]
MDELIGEIDRELQAGREPCCDEHKSQSERQQFIEFLLNEVVLAIRLSSALEICPSYEITPLPNLPEGVLGVCNIRGEIISVVDLKRYLRMSAGGFNAPNPLIVIRSNVLKTAIMVDKIQGLLSVVQFDPRLQASPIAAKEISPYLSGVFASGDRLVHLISSEKLLSALRGSAFKAE